MFESVSGLHRRDMHGGYSRSRQACRAARARTRRRRCTRCESWARSTRRGEFGGAATARSASRTSLATISTRQGQTENTRCDHGSSASRPPPATVRAGCARADLASPAVNHVISASDVARLRSGECLVLDPNPALLSASGFAAAMADLMGVVNRKGVAESHNPCNKGSFHGMLPVNPSSGAAEGLGPSTCELLRKLAALPALIERHGWPRPLALLRWSSSAFIRVALAPRTDRISIDGRPR